MGNQLDDAATSCPLKGSVDLALLFVAEFERTANLVLANRLLGAVFRGARRRYSRRRFPCRIIHKITAAQLRVLAVAHHRRCPGDWAERT